MADNSTLQAMYEYKRLASSNGEEYIVRGATMFCGDGEKECVLNLPEDHVEKTSDNRPLITIKDSKKEKNVEGFGYCKALKGPCIPALDDWSNKNVSNIKKLYDSSTQDYEYAVTRSATAKCSNGNFYVIFTSSGQVTPDYKGEEVGGIDIIEDIERDFEKDEEDFLGHIKVTNTGVYNLGIRVQEGEAFLGGTIFVYEKNKKKKLLYKGAYEFLEHKNDKRMGKYTSHIDEVKSSIEGESFFVLQKEYWSIWVNLVLNANIDYYVEIDCPSHDKFSYKLVGNCEVDSFRKIPKIEGVEKDFLKDRDSAIWQIDQRYKETQNYTDAAFERIGGKINSIYWLTGFYHRLFNVVLRTSLEKQHETAYRNIKTWGGNIFSIAGFLPDLWGKIFSVLALGISNLPDYILRKLKDDLELKQSPVKVVILDNCREVIINFEDRLSIDSYIYEISESQRYISRDDIEVTGDKYSIGNLVMFPGFTSDNDEEVEALFLDFLDTLGNDYSAH